MSKFAKGPNLHRNPCKALMRRASFAAFGVGVVVLAVIRFAALQAALPAFLLASWVLQAQAQTRDILVFGDASLKNALDDANNLFLFENAIRIVVTYGASAALARQIENGAPADVFIPADLDSMDYVAERKLIKPNTRENFVGNKLVLIAGADSKVALTIGQNFALAQALGDGRLAMPDPVAVSAGKYGKAALEALGVWGSVASKVSPTQDARATLLSVTRGEAPLGLVYQTDAAADKNIKIVAAFPESAHPPIIYPIAVLAGSTNVLAPIYVQYLRSPKGTLFFEKQGFVLH
jgi:molybdate transport system substrate-binding protein